MRHLLITRVALGVVTIFVVATITFILIHLAPGDPFLAALESSKVSAAVRDQLRAREGLDLPLAEQYVRYIGNLARGDLGFSWAYQRPVAGVLAEAVPNTLVLMGAAILGSFVLGVGLGVWQAVRVNGAADRALGAATIVVGSLPDFWLAIVVMLVFASWLGLFPVAGMIDLAMHDYMTPMGQLIDRLRHIALPAGTLAIIYAASVARFQRAAMLDVLPDDFVRTARAKGLGERAVIVRHALRNALLPTITQVGLAFPLLIGGAVFIETIFAWPGMGSVAVRALSMRDYNLVMADVILASALVVASGLLADLLQALADPRLRRA